MMEKKNPISITLEMTGMSQEMLARRTNVSRQTIANYMADPSKIPNGYIVELIKVTGLSYNQLFDCPKKNKFVCKVDADFTLGKDISAKIAASRGLLEVLNIPCSEGVRSHIEKASSIINADFEEVTNQIYSKIQKVIIAVGGGRNTGKATLVNYLLGESVLKEDLSIDALCYIKHIDELYIDEKKDGDEIYISYIKNGDEKILSTYVESLGRILEEIVLPDLSTREFTLYCHNDLLEKVTILALPSTPNENGPFGIFDADLEYPDSSLETRVFDFRKVVSQCDIVLYASALHFEDSGFLCGDTFPIVREIFGMDNKLRLVVATQANKVDIDDVELIIEDANERLKNFQEGMEDFNLKQNTILMEIYDDSICDTFNDNLSNCIDQAYETKRKELQNVVTEYCDNLIKTYSLFRDNPVEAFGLERQDKKSDYRLKEEYQSIHNEILKIIAKHEKSSIKSFRELYSEIITTDRIEVLLKQKNVKNKESSQKEFVSFLESLLQNGLANIMKVENEKLEKEINEILEEIKLDSSEAFMSDEKEMTKKNLLSSFLSALFGKNAFSNVAVGIDTISKIGLTAGVIKIVPMAMPLTIPLTVALSTVATSTMLYGVIAGNWMQRFSKKIVSSLTEKKAEQYYIDVIVETWNQKRENFEEVYRVLQEQVDKENENYELDEQQLMELKSALSLLFATAINIYTNLKL